MAAQEYPNNSDKRAQRITNSKESTSPAIDNMSPALTRIHPEDLFFMLFDEAPEAYLCLTDTGTVIHCNKKSEELFCASKKELVGTIFTQYLAEDLSVKERILNHMKGSEKGTDTRFNAHVRNSHGEMKEVELKISASLNNSQNMKCVMILIHETSPLKKKEDEISVQEAHYTTILENLPIGVAVNSVDPSVSFEYMNDNFSRFYRIDKEDLKNQDTFWDVVYEDPDYREKIKKRVLEDCASGDVTRMYWQDIPIIRDGELTYISARNIPLSDCGLMISTVWDVTDKIDTENKIIEQTIFLDRLLETIPSPIFYKDRSERYLGCNSAFEQYIGLSKADLIGKTAFDVSPSHLAKLYHQKDQELFEKPGMQVYEAKVKFADQTLHNVVFYKATTMDSKNMVDGIVGVMLDITNIKETEYNLKRAKQFIEGMLDGIQDIVGLQYPDHTIIRYNKAGYEALGKSYAEVKGKKCYELIGRKTPCKPCATSLALETKTNQTIERFIPEFSKYYECTSTPILNDVGEADLIVELLHDITERKIAEDALLQVNRQINLLSAITRHDILNSINVIELFLDLVKGKIEISPIRDEIIGLETAISKIQSQIEFTTIYQYLGTHKPQWQKIHLLLSHLSVPPEITFLVSGDSISVFADPLLKKVFENLLDNTIRHGQKVTTIRVMAREEENLLEIIWEDDGVGIPAGDKEKIFERGYGKNTGLGLFFIREILSITGISIRETGEEGRGVHFEIVVPSGTYRTEELSSHGETE